MPAANAEWFEDNADGGLRFTCTMCGNCCSGPEGYVRFTEEEGRRIAARLGVPYEVFVERYTRETAAGRSLAERPGPGGLDCIFLDRGRVPERAVCGIYEDRPSQCRTWPFWPRNLGSPRDWARAASRCPGIGRGPLHGAQQIRIQRDKGDP